MQVGALLLQARGNSMIHCIKARLVADNQHLRMSATWTTLDRRQVYHSSFCWGQECASVLQSSTSAHDYLMILPQAYDARELIHLQPE